MIEIAPLPTIEKPLRGFHPPDTLDIVTKRSVDSVLLVSCPPSAASPRRALVVRVDPRDSHSAPPLSDIRIHCMS
ncbi:hypothetical protein IU449_17715 [Nocardia higoensis]|uniref:Uncharacterized protein n=1 Tax=Nocardia higoensis TaxID=228599 RepID=A0ABS0DDZ7_9NOCA|nr:hypothetical protein [Nocardia higoensis]MBF6356360.1 hypothetical protein [Nocardia higoensis]